MRSIWLEPARHQLGGKFKVGVSSMKIKWSFELIGKSVIGVFIVVGTAVIVLTTLELRRLKDLTENQSSLILVLESEQKSSNKLINELNNDDK